MKNKNMILKNVPVLKRKRWAGNTLEKFKGVKGVGESWEVSTHPAGVSYVRIDNRIVPLTYVLEKYEEIFKFKECPIMVKILDVGKMLSVQVHPSDNLAKELGERDRGKTEGWIALSSGKVYIGLKDYSNIEHLTADLSNLMSINAEPFDAFPLPPGTIHSAESIILLEISTPSDITYRIYDPYGRETHIEKAKMCVRKIRVKKSKAILEMDEFCAKILFLKEEESFMDDKINIIVSMGEVEVKSKNHVKLNKFESCLVIPGCDYIISGRGVVARIWPLGINN